MLPAQKYQHQFRQTPISRYVRLLFVCYIAAVSKDVGVTVSSAQALKTENCHDNLSSLGHLMLSPLQPADHQSQLSSHRANLRFPAVDHWNASFSITALEWYCDLNMVNWYDEHGNFLEIIYHFVSFLEIDMPQLVEILPRGWQGFVFLQSVSCMLMTWLLTSPGHQHTWYWHDWTSSFNI